MRSDLDQLTPELPQYHTRLVHYVEDNETNVEVMRGILAQRPQVEMAVSVTGLDGLAAIRLRRPDRGVAVILCINNAGEDFNEPVSDALTRMVFGGEATMPPRVVSLPASAVEKFSGAYKTASGGSFAVTAAKAIRCRLGSK